MEMETTILAMKSSRRFGMNWTNELRWSSSIPTHPVDITPMNKPLAQPIIDYPHQTTRTAVDLIVSETIRTHQNVKIILSHAGGTLPWLAHRPASLVSFSKEIDKSLEEFLADAKSFYFDLALSGSPELSTLC
ncbi:amidohydrolase family protein [Rutstroemia sp. NJR-2017a BBW]|nr:amidohydrolase family protein [Rutstroemia sp. NJR-2017a BBW]